MPAVSILEPGPKRIPLGLMRNILPLAVRTPKIAEGSPPTTLFKAIELDEGWLNLTASQAAIEKLS